MNNQIKFSAVAAIQSLDMHAIAVGSQQAADTCIKCFNMPESYRPKVETYYATVIEAQNILQELDSKDSRVYIFKRDLK